MTCIGFSSLYALFSIRGEEQPQRAHHIHTYIEKAHIMGGASPLDSPAAAGQCAAAALHGRRAGAAAGDRCRRLERRGVAVTRWSLPTGLSRGRPAALRHHGRVLRAGRAALGRVVDVAPEGGEVLGEPVGERDTGSSSVGAGDSSTRHTPMAPTVHYRRQLLLRAWQRTSRRGHGTAY